MTQGQTEDGSFEQRERRRTVCREPAVRVLSYSVSRQYVDSIQIETVQKQR